MLSVSDEDSRQGTVFLTETKGWAAYLPYNMDGGSYIVGFATKVDAELVARALQYICDTSYMNA